MLITPSKKKKKKTKKPWITEETREAVEKRRNIKARCQNPDSIEEYRKQNANVQRLMRSDKNQQINSLCEKIETDSITNSTKDLYQGVKSLTRKFKPTIETVKDKDGVMLSDRSNVKERWKNYCEELFKKNVNINCIFNPTQDTSEQVEPPPLRSEIDKAIRDLKSSKTPGFDDIAAELVKKGGENVLDFFHVLCSKIWKERIWPEDWVTSIFLPIPKKKEILWSVVTTEQ